MKVFKVIGLSCMFAASVASSVALAGPEVQVIFKNNSNAEATYRVVGANATSTRMNASPKPLDKVASKNSNSYYVQSGIAPDVNYASVRYEIGGKACQFTTSYLKTRVRGVVMPKWNKSAVGSGGARCDARVTSVNPASHAWVVEFTMR